MTNDKTNMASNWEERLRPPKCNKKDDPHLWATTSFPYLLSLPDGEKNLNTNVLTTYKRPTTIGQKLTHFVHCAFARQKCKSKVCQGLASTVHSWLPRKTQQSIVPCVPQIMPKNETFPLNQNHWRGVWPCYGYEVNPTYQSSLEIKSIYCVQWNFSKIEWSRLRHSNGMCTIFPLGEKGAAKFF